MLITSETFSSFLLWRRARDINFPAPSSPSTRYGGTGEMYLTAPARAAEQGRTQNCSSCDHIFFHLILHTTNSITNHQTL